ncbi:MAG TPA: metallophosphoesterase [Holophagaceae bacterium]
MRFILALLAAAFLHAQSPFLVQPYLQLGDAPKPAARESLELMWQTEDRDEAWSVDVRGPKGWIAQARPVYRRMAAPPLPPHRIYRATLANLDPGSKAPYRVRLGKEVVFEATAQARKHGAHRFLVTGDAAEGTPEQAAIARAMAAGHPDFVFLVGDLVYGRGRAAEYRTRFFPIYNAEEAPLLRQVPFLGVPGNHDVPWDLQRWPDTLAYFAEWSLPLNGPVLRPGEPGAAPALPGLHDAILAAAGSAYPRMASYSFDYGGVHWTVLDSNAYADWDHGTLRAWLETDLKAAQSATWRVVALHHPLFQSPHSHAEDQWMRTISPLLERYGVDLVFAGHVHNYQRTAPLRFEPTKVRRRGEPVEGRFEVDTAFDGRKVTRAHGIIHLVTGAGGAHLYDRSQGADRTSWQPWTRAFVSDRHSFSEVDVEGRTLRFRQLDAEGRELDAFTLTK